MSDKNQIIEEQRKAREEFLKLKRMQNGELVADPKPSEVAITPITFKEKSTNFWFYYKWYIIALLATILFLIIAISQCVNRTKYDYKIMYFTYTPILDEQADQIADYISKVASDINGDGKVNVQIINCSVSNDKSASQHKNAKLSKMQAIIAADEDVVLFITDNESFEFFNDVAEGSGGLFDGKPYVFSEKFYTNFSKEYSMQLPDNLQISVRRISNTVLENNKNAIKAYNDSKKLLNNLKY